MDMHGVQSTNNLCLTLLITHSLQWLLRKATFHQTMKNDLAPDLCYLCFDDFLPFLTHKDAGSLFQDKTTVLFSNNCGICVMQMRELNRISWISMISAINLLAAHGFGRINVSMGVAPPLL